MTDNEIIKALECCATAVFCSEKTDCPYKGIDDCVKRHTFDALDLINRLQAENERLMGSVMTYKVRWAKATSRLDKAKAEAYKEFAERLKGTFPQDDFLRSTKRISEDIDNLLKKLVGDK